MTLSLKSQDKEEIDFKLKRSLEPERSRSLRFFFSEPERSIKNIKVSKKMLACHFLTKNESERSRNAILKL